MRPGPARRAGPVLAGLFLAVMLAGCSSVTTPSGLPSSLPTTLPSIATNSAGTACLDAATMAVITQLQAPNADVQAILTANKDALLAGLQSFQPTDPTTVKWRDDLIAALQGSDMTTAAAKIKEITTAGITLASC